MLQSFPAFNGGCGQFRFLDGASRHNLFWAVHHCKSRAWLRSWTQQIQPKIADISGCCWFSRTSFSVSGSEVHERLPRENGQERQIWNAGHNVSWTLTWTSCWARRCRHERFPGSACHYRAGARFSRDANISGRLWRTRINRLVRVKVRRPHEAGVAWAVSGPPHFERRSMKSAFSPGLAARWVGNDRLGDAGRFQPMVSYWRRGIRQHRPRSCRHKNRDPCHNHSNLEADRSGSAPMTTQSHRLSNDLMRPPLSQTGVNSQARSKRLPPRFWSTAWMPVAVDLFAQLRRTPRQAHKSEPKQAKHSAFL